MSTIYFNSKFKITCKRGLGMPVGLYGTSELIPKKTRLKFLTLHSPFCFFLIKILKTNLPFLSTLESISLDETIRCASKWFTLTQRNQNLEFVDLKCVTYTQLIPLSLIRFQFEMQKYQMGKMILTYNSDSNASK